MVSIPPDPNPPDALPPPPLAVGERPRRRRKLKLPITAVLMLGFGGLIFLAVAGVLSLAIQSSSKNTLTLLTDKAELVMEGLEMRVRAQLDPARIQAEYVAAMIERGEVDPGDHRRMEDVLRAALAATPHVTGLGFVDPRGFWLTARRSTQNGPVTFGVFPDPASVEEAMELARKTGSAVWLDPEWVSDLRASFLSVRVPVRRAGKLAGAVVGGVSFQDLSRFLQDLRGSVGEHAFILYGDSYVLAHAELVDRVQDFSEARRDGVPPLPALDSLSDPITKAIWSDVDPNGFEVADKRLGRPQAAPRDMRIRSGGNRSGLEFRDAEVGPDNTEYVYLLKRIQDYGMQPWTLVIAFETSTVDKEMRRLFRLVIAGFAILVVSVLLSLLLGRGISRQIKRLAGAAVALRELDFRRVPELPDSHFHEIAEAAEAFNTMVGGLRWFETYVPKALVLRLIRRDRGRGGVESEERDVSVMFTDIKGFSALAESMGPADTAALLNSHFDRVAACIEAEGGTVDKFIGDAVMAFWGAPEQQDDHAARALRAARAIVAVVDQEAREAAEAGRPPLCLRIGIHSGPVVVGNIGAASRINYTIVGDTVNAAARLEALGDELLDGEPSVVLASADTVAAAGDCGVTMVRVGDFALRGRAVPVSVWRLLIAGADAGATLAEPAVG